MQRILPATLVIVLLVFSCAAAAVPLRERPTRGDVANATQEILARALQQVREKNAAGASATFARAFSSGGFARLPERQRFLAWSMAAAAAAEARDYASSLDWSTRAIALSSTSATEDLWRLRLEAAYQLENYPDSARSLVAIARQWPKALQDLKAQAITRVLSKLDKDRAHADVQFDLLCSLFDAGWTSDGQQPGWKWLQLARMDEGVFTLAYVNLAHGNGTVLFTNSANGPQIVLPLLERIGEDRAFVAFLRRTAG